ncbi:protein of unknown function [Bradyrhizobium vignae]|uniref:Uncharacterized protein n=1 Tax=Bradyrhizobium vignae TaxID=1549949 RepID=A0A2U3Q8Z8_9BRAD|nr:protein of unknown function [Bradyrhizobium vignae]
MKSTTGVKQSLSMRAATVLTYIGTTATEYGLTCGQGNTQNKRRMPQQTMLNKRPSYRRSGPCLLKEIRFNRLVMLAIIRRAKASVSSAMRST